MLQVLIHLVKEVKNTKAPIMATNSSPLLHTIQHLSAHPTFPLFLRYRRAPINRGRHDRKHGRGVRYYSANHKTATSVSRDPRSIKYRPTHKMLTARLRLRTLKREYSKHLPLVAHKQSCVLTQLLAQPDELIAQPIKSYLSVCLSVCLSLSLSLSLCVCVLTCRPKSSPQHSETCNHARRSRHAFPTILRDIPHPVKNFPQTRRPQKHFLCVCSEPRERVWWLKMSPSMLVGGC